MTGTDLIYTVLCYSHHSRTLTQFNPFPCDHALRGLTALTAHPERFTPPLALQQPRLIACHPLRNRHLLCHSYTTCHIALFGWVQHLLRVFLRERFLHNANPSLHTLNASLGPVPVGRMLNDLFLEQVPDLLLVSFLL